MRIIVILSCFAFTGFALPEPQNKGKCSQEDAIRVETEASSLKDWGEVYRSYRNFARCDDASIGEGYSDSVARLLSADGEGRLDELYSFTLRDRSFERFVLRHVDELMSPDQAKKIHENALSHCPMSAKRLCNAIVSKLDKMARTRGH